MVLGVLSRQVMVVPKQVTEKDYAACYNKALDLLSRRVHFVSELRRKLVTRGFQADDVSRALEALDEAGFLNDEEAARQFAEGRQRRLGEVGLRLVQELRKRGVDSDLAARVVEGLGTDGHDAMARQMVESLRMRGAQNEKIARHLNRKGFGKAAILRILEE